MIDPTFSQSMSDSPTRTAPDMFGNMWKRSTLSRVEWAVSTLNLPVSRTSLRTERACNGSGSATNNVGLGTWLHSNWDYRDEFKTEFCPQSHYSETGRPPPSPPVRSAPAASLVGEGYATRSLPYISFTPSRQLSGIQGCYYGRLIMR